MDTSSDPTAPFLTDNTRGLIMIGTQRNLRMAAFALLLALTALALPARASASSSMICGAPICTSGCSVISCDYLTDGKCPNNMGCTYVPGCVASDGEAVICE